MMEMELLRTNFIMRPKKQGHENDTSIESHTDGKNVIKISDESMETSDTIRSNKNDILHNIKDFKEMSPRKGGKGDMVPDIKKSKETNNDPSLNLEKEYMNNALGDERKDVPKLHTNYVKEKRKCIDKGIEGTLRTPITSLSKRNEFKILSVANIIIFSALFGVVLTKEIGGLRENGLLKETSRWKSSDTRDKDGMNEKTIENTLISAFDCLDSSLPSTRISLNPPKQCNIEDG